MTTRGIPLFVGGQTCAEQACTLTKLFTCEINNIKGDPPIEDVVTCLILKDRMYNRSV